MKKLNDVNCEINKVYENTIGKDKINLFTYYTFLEGCGHMYWSEKSLIMILDYFKDKPYFNGYDLVLLTTNFMYSFKISNKIIKAYILNLDLTKYKISELMELFPSLKLIDKIVIGKHVDVFLQKKINEEFNIKIDNNSFKTNVSNINTNIKYQIKINKLNEKIHT